MREALLGCPDHGPHGRHAGPGGPGLLFGLGLLLASCLPTKYQPYTCTNDSQCLAQAGVSAGLRCDVTQHLCVCSGPGAPGCAPYAGGADGAVAETGGDGSAKPNDGSAKPNDGSADVPMVSDSGEPPATSGDGSTGEARPPDAPGTCAANIDCTDPETGFCQAGVCVGCQAVVDAGACAAPTPSCDTSTGRCVGCTADSQCTADPGKAFCVGGACVGCGVAGATGCAGRTDGKTVCATAGNAAGQCVACAIDSDCVSPAQSFCVANACVGCQKAAATACRTRAAATPVCSASGATAGQCVACGADSDCTSPAQSFCVANACAGCQAAAASACSKRSAATPVCGQAGTALGQCVECNASADCTVASKPICAANACGACSADSQCAAKLGSTGNPGVCLDNIDGHCATDAETVYVQNSTDCSSTAAGGTAAAPFCAAQAGIGAAKSSGKPLVVITGTLAAASTVLSLTAPLTIVGKSSATLTPATGGDGIDITSGTVYLRNLSVQGSASSSTGIGISAAPTAGSAVTLHLDTCAVEGNPGGGILLNGAAFTLANATVTGNGPGILGAISWGGVLVSGLPASGPTTLDLVTISTNDGGGLTCSGAISGSGVLSLGNTNAVSPIGATCGFSSCPSAGATCGAQAQPQ